MGWDVDLICDCSPRNDTEKITILPLLHFFPSFVVAERWETKPSNGLKGGEEPVVKLVYRVRFDCTWGGPSEK